MKLGITGLPNVGKSTLFNAITQAGAEVANYPYCTIEPNLGVVNVPDARLEWLRALNQSERVIPATIEFVDIAGLIQGASRGEGLGNQFLANIREVDAILHVVRCFDDEDVVHVSGGTDAARDIEIINIELVLADLDHIQKRIDRVERQVKGDRSLQPQLDLLLRLREVLEAGEAARTVALSRDEELLLGDLNLLTRKPILYVANVGEDEVQAYEDNPHVAAVRAQAEREGAGHVVVSAAIEAEIASLDPEERSDFLADLGLEISGLDRIIAAGYDLLDQISYLTAGPKEVRAWTITRGTKAPQAAGKIHSDFERGFIRAEVVSYADLERYGTMAGAREHGVYRSEGRDYVIQDGDVVLFRFNV